MRRELVTHQMMGGRLLLNWASLDSIATRCVGPPPSPERSVAPSAPFPHFRPHQWPAAILRQARQVFLVMDASKLDRPAPVRLASLSEVDALFTDQPLPGDLMAKCADWQTAVHVVPVA